MRDTPNWKKRETWQILADEHYLPREVAHYFDSSKRAMLGLEADDREHENIHAWAAFAHVGA